MPFSDFFFCADFLKLFYKKEIEENLEKSVLQCKILVFNKKIATFAK
jgi:hypothetical protein